MSIVSESYFEDWSDFKATFHQHLPGWGRGNRLRDTFYFAVRLTRSGVWSRRSIGTLATQISKRELI